MFPVQLYCARKPCFQVMIVTAANNIFVLPGSMSMQSDHSTCGQNRSNSVGKTRTRAMHLYNLHDQWIPGLYVCTNFSESIIVEKHDRNSCKYVFEYCICINIKCYLSSLSSASRLGCYQRDIYLFHSWAIVWIHTCSTESDWRGVPMVYRCGQLFHTRNTHLSAPLFVHCERFSGELFHSRTFHSISIHQPFHPHINVFETLWLMTKVR